MMSLTFGLFTQVSGSGPLRPLVFFQFYPTHSRSVYDPTGMILAILYSKVPHMLHAKYQHNWHSSSGEEVV